MNETALTPIATSEKYGEVRKGLRYANDEMAWLNDDSIASSTLYSTAINFWSYNVVTKELVVKYKSSDIHYTYEGVPHSVIFDMMFADSLGSFIAKTIKPTYSVA
jgi:hypothetical protein